MPGVKKVVSIDGNAVVVVADTYWNAKHGARRSCRSNGTSASWARSSSETITAMLKEGLDASEAFVGNKAGDAKAAIDGAAKKVEATYAFPYQHHVTMEPMNATARYTRRQVRGVVRHAERRGGAGRRVGGLRAAGRQVRGLQA